MDNNQLFEKSKEFFNKRDIINTIDAYEKHISHIKGSKERKQSEYFNFLNDLLKYCKDNNLKEEEALVLRAMGRTYSIFKKHAESLKFHWASLKIQRKIGKNFDVAEGLIFLAEDLEVSGDYDECISTYLCAADLFRELGKLRKVKGIQKEVSRLKEFSREIVEDEYIMNKFHVDEF